MRLCSRGSQGFEGNWACWMETGFAVAEHGNDDDMVGGEGSIALCKCQGGVDAAAVAGWYAGCLLSCWVVRAIGDFDWECGAIGEGEGGSFVVFDSSRVVRCSRHYTLMRNESFVYEWGRCSYTSCLLTSPLF